MRNNNNSEQAASCATTGTNRVQTEAGSVLFGQHSCCQCTGRSQKKQDSEWYLFRAQRAREKNDRLSTSEFRDRVPPKLKRETGAFGC